MWLRDNTGVIIDTIPVDENGKMDIEKSKEMIKAETKLISITHVPTSSGSIAPIEYFGKLAKQHNIIYMVDACQSVGQIPIDVEKIQCDILCATSRKYMRGPRGMGFLYVKESLMPKLEMPFLNMMSAKWIAAEHYEFTPGNLMFDHWEKPFSILKGFEASIRVILEIGVENIWNQVQELSQYFRNALNDLAHFECMDKGDILCGIVTFKHNSIPTEQVFEALGKAGINTSISYNWSSFTDLDQKRTESVNRASIHFLNTKFEIDACIDVLKSMN
jgi:selenocysteine lyase/cysteine desulfurase